MIPLKRAVRSIKGMKGSIVSSTLRNGRDTALARASAVLATMSHRVSGEMVRAVMSMMVTGPTAKPGMNVVAAHSAPALAKILTTLRQRKYTSP